MGLLKGNFTFTRFHVEGQLPQAFLNFVNSRIKANAFREKTKSTDEKRLGWVSLTDLLDADFEQANYTLGDYLIFSLRIDRKLIPPKLMKVKLMEVGCRNVPPTLSLVPHPTFCGQDFLDIQGRTSYSSTMQKRYLIKKRYASGSCNKGNSF